MAIEPIHRVPGGRWELRYRDPSGQPRRRRFDTKAQAREYLAEVRIGAKTGTWTAPECGRITFERWEQQWWSTVVHLRPSTLARYERDLRLHIVPRFGRVPLARVAPTDVRAWLAQMVDAGASRSAVRRRFAVFRKVMNDAVALEMVARNPCRGVRAPADVTSEIVVLSPGEVAALAGAIHPWFSSWIYTAAYTGLRWSEMLGLRRSDVDPLRRMITVRRQIVEVNGRFLGFGEPKTAAARRAIDIPPFLATLLEEQLLERAQMEPDGLVFVNTRRRPPHASSFASQTWKKARLAIGRPDLRWHDLRHTAVAFAIAEGAHPKAIQERMGHSSITVTLDRYGHLFPSLGAEIANGLERLFQRTAGDEPTDASDAVLTRTTRD
jgi:integrase